MAQISLRVAPMPRMLSERDAAHYAGLPPAKFRAICPVRPVEFPSGDRRFDVRDLDTWIDAIKGCGSGEDEILAKLG